MTLEQAAKQARQYPHGSRLHQDAMTVLFRLYRYHYNFSGHIELDRLWKWVDKQLELKNQSHLN